MTGEPVPTWARVVAIVVGVSTGVVVLPTILLGAVSLASTAAMIEHTTAFDVGTAPRLQVDDRFGDVVIVAASDGRVVVHDRRSASAITRAAAGAAVRNISVDVSRQGDLVVVRQARDLFTAPEVNSGSTLRIEVPAHTDVDASNVGDLRMEGIDGTLRIQGAGTAELSGVTLRGDSSLDESVGDIQMTNVTVAGSVLVTKRLGGVTFDGRLAPGGSSLDIEGGTGDVTVTLPRTTDARAVVTAQTGDFHADHTWLFTPDTVVAPRRWTADLGPDPTGTVTVSSTLGTVTFTAR